MTTLTLGIDLGGTNIKGGVIAADGRILVGRSIDTQASGGFSHVYGRLVGLIRELLGDPAGGGAGAIGVGVPGPMSHERGHIHAAPNLPGWVNIPLRDLLTRDLSVRVTIENDANAAAFGELVAGAGRGCRDMVMLTLGTGIGGGIILGGRLIRGAFDNAGEIGHVIVESPGRPCPCGQSGCLERYASAHAIGERAAEAIRAGRASSLTDVLAAAAQLTAADVCDAAHAGDALAAELWDDACRTLAIACVNLQHLLNPQKIVLAGGLINAGARLLDPIRKHFAALTWRIAPDLPEIALAKLGGDAGIVGAAALARG
jgi:glucokinase